MSRPLFHPGRRPLQLSALCLALACGPADRPGDAAPVLSAVARLDSAWSRKDTALVDRLLAPEYVYFSSKGGVTSRSEAIGLLRSESYRLEYADRSELEVHQTGSTAVVASRWRGRGTFGGTAFVDDQRCSLVLDRTGVEWRVLSEHCTQIAT